MSSLQAGASWLLAVPARWEWMRARIVGVYEETTRSMAWFGVGPGFVMPGRVQWQEGQQPRDAPPQAGPWFALWVPTIAVMVVDLVFSRWI